MLGVLGAISLLSSDMPRVVAWPLALSACLHGWWLARRERRGRACAWVWAGDGAVTVDGIDARVVEMRWRGPLAFLCWRDPDGHLRRQAWWPDTLAPGARRELRLAVERNSASRSAPRMAG